MVVEPFMQAGCMIEESKALGGPSKRRAKVKTAFFMHRITGGMRGLLAKGKSSGG